MRALVVVPPLCFVGYPSHEAAEVCGVLVQAGFNYDLTELNLSYLEELRKQIDLSVFENEYSEAVGDWYGKKIQRLFLEGRATDFKKVKPHALLLEALGKEFSRTGFEKYDVVIFVFDERAPTLAIQWSLSFSALLKREGVKTVFCGSRLWGLDKEDYAHLNNLEVTAFSQPDFHGPSNFLHVFSGQAGSCEPSPPDYSRFKLSEYLNFQAGTRIFGYSASIGCGGGCTFCAQKYGRAYAAKKPQTVAEDLEAIKSNGGEIVRFYDRLLNVPNGAIPSSLPMLEKSGLFWGGMARADGSGGETFQKFYQAGCRFLWFGVETGSEELRKKMGKPMSNSTVLHTLADCKKAGIRSTIFLMTDFPLDNPARTAETLSFLEKARAVADGVSLQKFSVSKNSTIAARPESFGVRLKPSRSLALGHQFEYLQSFSNEKTLADACGSLWGVARLVEIEGRVCVTRI